MKRNLATKARLDKLMEGVENRKNNGKKLTSSEVKDTEEHQKETELTPVACSSEKINEERCFQKNATSDRIEEFISKYEASCVDFSSGSSDDYIPNSDSDSSSDSYCPKKNRKIAHLNKKHISESSDSCNEKEDSDCNAAESASDKSVSLLLKDSQIPHYNSQLPDEKVVDTILQAREPEIPNINIDVSDKHPKDAINENAQITEENIEEGEKGENKGSTTPITQQSEIEQKRKRKVRKSFKERREERKARLALRNAGKSYVTKLGKIKPNRNLAPLKDCRMKCNIRITDEVREYVFLEYWNLGSYDERARYVEKLIKVQKKKTNKEHSKRHRQFSNTYKLIYYAEEFKICKGCLLKTLGESSRFLQTINEKIQKYGKLPKSERGRAASYKKISDDRLKDVEKHILKFPAYESHYSRAKSSKKYLSPDLCLDTMYSMYAIENDNPVCKTIYNKVFKDLNLSFKKPTIDSCNKCNILNTKLKYVTEPDEHNKINTQLVQHLEICEMAYEEKRNDKTIAKTDKEICVVAFDLQQCLPTPMLNTQSAFYKRQLWVFNLTIHDFLTNNAYCYMWPESSGGRGANQIASCLYDFIMTRLPLLYPTAKHLIMYSDSCSGQNKNSIVATALMLAVKESEQLITIQHKFLIPGHTHMEVDSDHALIERAKKKTSMNIHHPRDWCQLVRSASKRNNKFSVIEMSENDFYDFAKFSKQHLLIKKINATGNKFVWTNVRVMKFSKHQFPEFGYKENFKQDEYLSMSYSKRNKDYQLVSLNAVEKCYDGPVPISVQKKRDLISLLEYIDPSVHDFYHQLRTKSDLRDVLPDVTASEDDD